jgi:hypothetical protein
MFNSDSGFIILFFGLILTFIFLLLPIILIFYLVSLGSRLKKLEEKTSKPEVKKEVKREIIPETILEEKTVTTIQPEIKSGTVVEFGFLKWLTEDWIMKLGALLLLFGFGFLVSYAFIYDLISPTGRIIFGLTLGIGVITFGSIRINKYPVQGDIFLVLGASITLISVIAGRTFIEFFTPFTAIATVFLTASLISYISVIEKRNTLTYLSLIFAGLAPILSFAPTYDAVSLSVYLLIIILGTIWVTYLTNVKWLTLISSLIFTVYTAGLLFNQYGEYSINLALVYILTAVLLLNGIFSLAKQRNLIGDLITTAWSGLYLSIWILNAPYGSLSDSRSILLSITAIIYISVAYYFYKKLGSKPILYTLSSVGFFMIYNSIGLLLDENLQVVILILEIVTLSITNYLVTKDVKVSRIINLLLLIPMLITLPSIFIGSDPYLGVYYPEQSYLFGSTDFLNLLALASALLGLGYFYHQQATESKSEFSLFINRAALIIGSLYFYRIIWLFVNEIFSSSQYWYEFSISVSLFIYTCFGLGTYFYGLKNNSEISRRYGIVLLVAIVLRILFVEMFYLDILGRVITLLAIGSLLISTAFYSKRFTGNDRIKP